MSEVLTYEALWSWELGVGSTKVNGTSDVPRYRELAIGSTYVWQKYCLAEIPAFVETSSNCRTDVPCPNLAIPNSDPNSSDPVGNLQICFGKVYYWDKTTPSIYIRGSWPIEVQPHTIDKKSIYYILLPFTLPIPLLSGVSLDEVRRCSRWLRRPYNLAKPLSVRSSWEVFASFSGEEEVSNWHGHFVGRPYCLDLSPLCARSCMTSGLVNTSW